MTNTQLYLAIGVPVVLNTIFNAVLIGFVWQHFNSRLDDLRQHFDARLNDLDKAWGERLLRVEQVMDARLKHLEDGRAL